MFRSLEQFADFIDVLLKFLKFHRRVPEVPHDFCGGAARRGPIARQSAGRLPWSSITGDACHVIIKVAPGCKWLRSVGRIVCSSSIRPLFVRILSHSFAYIMTWSDLRMQCIRM
jgi:hypothetical protein